LQRFYKFLLRQQWCEPSKTSTITKKHIRHNSSSVRDSNLRPTSQLYGCFSGPGFVFNWGFIFMTEIQDMEIKWKIWIAEFGLFDGRCGPLSWGPSATVGLHLFNNVRVLLPMDTEVGICVVSKCSKYKELSVRYQWSSNAVQQELITYLKRLRKGKEQVFDLYLVHVPFFLTSLAQVEKSLCMHPNSRDDTALSL
jgi:hypothetical protein